MESNLLFTGFKNFKSKDKTKDYFVLEFLTEPKNYPTGSFCTQVTVFTEKEKYNNFTKEHDLMDYCSVPYEIVGDKVRFFI